MFCYRYWDQCYGIYVSCKSLAHAKMSMKLNLARSSNLTHIRLSTNVIQFQCGSFYLADVSAAWWQQINMSFPTVHELWRTHTHAQIDTRNEMAGMSSLASKNATWYHNNTRVRELHSMIWVCMSNCSQYRSLSDPPLFGFCFFSRY